MDEMVQVSVKEETTSDIGNHHEEELIIPDFVSSEDNSSNEDFKVEKVVKPEPLEIMSYMDADDDLETPYQCFECGLDCESQRGLIDHYETTHTGQNPFQLDDNGNSCLGTEGDPLAGDEAPDSPKKTGNVEGAQNDGTPREVLLLYSCPCCGHSDLDWNLLVKHMEKHVQVNCLSCPDCMHIFSRSYPSKDYTGKDPSDERHICCHCQFKTRWYQVLKDHCVAHHKNTAADGSFHNLPKSAPSDTLEGFNSLPPNSIPTLAVPYSGSQAGCFVVVSSNIPGHQGVVNVAAPISSVIPGIRGVCSGPNNVNIIPQVLNLNQMNPLPEPTVQQGYNACNSSTITLTHHPGGIYNGSVNTPSNETLLSKLEPKMENPAESYLAALPRLPIPESGKPTSPSKSPVNIHKTFQKSVPNPPLPKSSNRTVSPKVPVDELLKRWGISNVFPTPPTPVSHPNPPILLTGLPPLSAPGVTLEKTRKGVKTKPCPYCSYVARDAHNLKMHIFTHTNENPNPLLPKSANLTVPPKVPVDELHKRSDISNVAPTPVSHPNPPTLLTGLPPSRAPRGTLEKTRRGIKTKPCPYCSHVARDAHSLKTHIFTHTNEKPFKCDICNYRATQRAHIQKHMATHINPRGKHYRGEVSIER